MTTIWRPVPGTTYEVSVFGDVRRQGTKRDGSPHRTLKPYGRGGRGGQRYPAVKLGRDGGQWYVHQLVALAFLGPRPLPHSLVHHVDDDEDNPCASNLQWTTPVGNALANLRDGPCKAPPRWSPVFEPDAPGYHPPLTPSSVVERRA